MAATYEPIASQTLGSTATSVTFSSIPATYTDLVLVYQIVSTTVAVAVSSAGRFNSDTGSNYSNTVLWGTGSSAASDRESNQTSGRFGQYGSRLPTSPVSGRVQIMNYASTSVYKTWLTDFANASNEVVRIVGLWRSTSAITSVNMFTSNSGWAAGSTFSLYGIGGA